MVFFPPNIHRRNRPGYLKVLEYCLLLFYWPPTEEFSSLCKAAIFLMKHHHKKYQQPPIRNRHPPKADQLFCALKCLTTWQGAQFQHCSSYHEEQVSSSNLMIPFTQHTAGFFSLFKASRRPPRSSSSGCWKFGRHLLLLLLLPAALCAVL